MALSHNRLVQLSDQTLTIKRYDFPLAAAKIVSLDDIKKVTVWPPGLVNGRLRLWRTGSPGIWYAFDWRRPARAVLFRVHRRSQRIDPIFRSSAQTS